MASIRKSHNVSELFYHIVLVVKYRKKLIDNKIQQDIIDSCMYIENQQNMRKQEIVFHEIGAEKDHIHFLVQSCPMMSPMIITKTIKGATGKHVFFCNPQLRSELRKHEWWSNGYYISSVDMSDKEAFKKTRDKNRIVWYIRGQKIED